jgi:DNA-binding MarR family transcriptional regulator
VNDELERDVTDFWMLAFKIVLDGEKRLTAQLAAHSLTPPQFYVLKTLVESGGQCPIGQIARQHQLTNATMTGLVKRLEAMSPPLVSRETSADDRRSVMVSLTPAGIERVLAVQADLIGQIREVLRLVSPSERQDLIHYLSRYVNLLEEQFPLELQDDSSQR